MNQSGIQGLSTEIQLISIVPEEIKKAFNDARTSNKLRWLKLVIEGETLKLAAQKELTDSFEKDTLFDLFFIYYLFTL